MKHLPNLQNLPFGASIAPGLNLLQSLAGQAGKGLGAVGQWVAPTMDPEEIDKRIEELRTVQFWLEQNAKILGATIQALEVQKMTLSTLQSLNLKLPEVPELMKAAVQQGVDLVKGQGPSTGAAGAADGEGTAPPLVDPMAWWNALTEQFSQIAAQAGVKASDGASAPAAAKKPSGTAARKRAAGSGAGAGHTASDRTAPRTGKTGSKTAAAGPTSTGRKAPSSARTSAGSRTPRKG